MPSPLKSPAAMKWALGPVVKGSGVPRRTGSVHSDRALPTRAIAVAPATRTTPIERRRVGRMVPPRRFERFARPPGDDGGPVKRKRNPPPKVRLLTKGGQSWLLHAWLRHSRR